MKLKLKQKQRELLEQISAPHLDKTVLSETDQVELYDYIIDYVMYHEVIDGDISVFGASLLKVHNDIVD